MTMMMVLITVTNKYYNRRINIITSSTVYKFLPYCVFLSNTSDELSAR